MDYNLFDLYSVFYCAIFFFFLSALFPSLSHHFEGVWICPHISYPLVYLCMPLGTHSLLVVLDLSVYYFSIKDVGRCVLITGV